MTKTMEEWIDSARQLLAGVVIGARWSSTGVVIGWRLGFSEICGTKIDHKLQHDWSWFAVFWFCWLR